MTLPSQGRVQGRGWHHPPVTEFDLIIRGGTVIDGSGNIGRRADVGVLGDRILAIGDLRAEEDTAIAELTGVSAARS